MLGIRTNHYYHDENDVYEQNSCETSSTYAQSTDGGNVKSTVEYSNVIACEKDEDNNHQDDGIFTANSSLN